MACTHDWRHAFRFSYEQTRKDLLEQRRAGRCDDVYDVGGRIWRPSEMSDDEIEFVARRMAEKYCQENINRYNEDVALGRI